MIVKGFRRPVRDDYHDPMVMFRKIHAKPAPPACVALSPAALEARLQVYEMLAEQRLPLFEEGDEPQCDGIKYQCWGCGCLPPLREHGGHRMQPEKVPGWVRVQSIADGVRKVHIEETWCPQCAAVGGFGCVEEPEPEEAVA